MRIDFGQVVSALPRYRSVFFLMPVMYIPAIGVPIGPEKLKPVMFRNSFAHPANSEPTDLKTLTSLFGLVLPRLYTPAYPPLKLTTVHVGFLLLICARMSYALTPAYSAAATSSSSVDRLLETLRREARIQ